MTSVSQSQDLPQDLQAMMKSSHSGNSRQNSACTQSYLIATHWYVVNRLKDSQVQNHGAHSGTMHFSLLKSAIILERPPGALPFLEIGVFVRVGGLLQCGLYTSTGLRLWCPPKAHS